VPLIGTRDMSLLRDAAPRVARLTTEALVFPRAEVLQALVEIDDARLLDMLPKAVHPTIPPLGSILVWHCPEGPLGPFTLAQVRVQCRAGFRSRGYLLGAYCDSESAAAVLRDEWGFDCRIGEVRLDRYFDARIGTVTAEGREILRVSLVNPVILSGSELETSANFNLARVSVNGEEQLRLMQVEPEYVLERPDRGTPRVDTFVAEAWSAEGFIPEYPVAAVHFGCELRLPPVRYLIDPDVPLQDGTQYVGPPAS
jgi:hypothetical protein